MVEIGSQCVEECPANSEKRWRNETGNDCHALLIRV
jgi:hypothetical protein